MGESAHFRLFIDPDIDPSTLAPSQQGQPALDALETDWADKQSMLQMPEGQKKIDYHLMTGQHIADACDVEFEGTVTSQGCEIADQLEIAAGYLPHQHELMHAYMDLVTSSSRSIPFLVEGTAQAIGCGTEAGTDLTFDPSWQQTVAQVASDVPSYVYDEGGLFARYLIRTQGIDAWVRYYRQAPGRRDPALFAENFSAFWNMAVDDVWTAMHIVQPGASSTDDAICPCSLAVLPDDGQPIPSDATHPYWTIGGAEGASVGIAAPSGEPIAVHDCEGVTPYFLTGNPGFPPGTQEITDANVAIVQLADGRSHYLPSRISTASAGQYLGDGCAGTTPYTLPADFLAGPGNVWVLFTQGTAAAATKFFQLQVPFAAQVVSAPGAMVCDSCAFGQGACPAPPPRSVDSVTSNVAPGPLNVELPLWLPGGAAGPGSIGSVLQFSQ